MTTRPTDTPVQATLAAIRTSPPKRVRKPGAPPPAAEPTLAFYGGPRAVDMPHRERWRRIRAGEMLRIARYAMRDINTMTAGDCIADLENRFQRLTGARFALAMCNGTATLHSAYFAAGVRPGDEVLVPTYTFPASATPILQLGGTPVFCDIDPQTLTVDPDDVERRITPRTRAICAVHIWGNPAKMDRLAVIAERHKLTLIEDCSHAHGATYRGRPVGSWGHIGCFSMQGAKPASGGELGMAVTSDPTLFDHMLALGHFGRVGRHQQAGTYDIDGLSLGFKYRPHTYAVLLGLGSLGRLDRLNRLRRRNYGILADHLEGCTALQPISAYPGAQRGGLLEFVFRFSPKHAGGVTAGMFARLAAAEGAPIQRDRYTLLGERGRLLHELPLFMELDYSELGGFIAGGSNRYRDASQRAQLPVAESLADRLLSMPPLTDVDEKYIHAVGRALRKVADTLPKITDLRIGA